MCKLSNAFNTIQYNTIQYNTMRVFSAQISNVTSLNSDQTGMHVESSMSAIPVSKAYTSILTLRGSSK